MNIMRDNNVALSGPLSVLITLRPGEGGERDIRGFFDKAYLAALAEEYGGALPEVVVNKPSVLCGETDTSDVWVDGEKTPLDVEAKPELGVPGGEYRVIKKQPATPGMVILFLEARQ